MVAGRGIWIGFDEMYELGEHDVAVQDRGGTDDCHHLLEDLAGSSEVTHTQKDGGELPKRHPGIIAT